jgi:hypothetical protein
MIITIISVHLDLWNGPYVVWQTKVRVYTQHANRRFVYYTHILLICLSTYDLTSHVNKIATVL